MATDRLVTSKHVLKAVTELERRRSREVLSEWERLEPDLMEFVLERLTDFYHELLDAGLSGMRARRLYRQGEMILMVSLIALRRAQREAWVDDPPESDSAPPDSLIPPT